MQRQSMLYLSIGSAVLVLALMTWLSFTFFLQKNEEEQTGSNDDFLQELSAGEEKEPPRQNEEKTEPENQAVMVDVKGAVARPGVYELTGGKRVIDAIDTAGGVLENGEPLAVNFAEKVYDEMVIYVPEKGETSEVETIQSGRDKDQIRINYADAAELEELPGIGPAKAGAIITYREDNGLFEKEEDLLQVSGIGEASLQKLKEKITLQ